MKWKLGLIASGISTTFKADFEWLKSNQLGSSVCWNQWLLRKLAIATILTKSMVAKIKNWWKQRHRKYSQIYLDSTSIFYTFCVTFTFIFYFFESLIQFTGWGEVRCGCSQIPSLGTNSITRDKFHHLEQISSLGTNSITWSKYHHLGQIPAFASNLSSNSQRPHILLPGTYCTRGSPLKYLTNAFPSAWLKSRWRRRRGPPTRSPPWSTVSPGVGSTVWGTLIWSLWGQMRQRERNATTCDSPRCILQKQKGIHSHSKANSAV